MGARPASPSRSAKLMAYTAAAMYGGAAFDGAIEGFLPGDPGFAVTPVLIAFVVVALLLTWGPRLAPRSLAPLGPLGVILIAYALIETPGAGDGAVLYTWPVLWTTLFFGRRGAISIVACVGVAHVITLLLLPDASSYPGRWVDVMVSVTVVSAIVLTLAHRNELLLRRLADEARVDALTGLLNRRGFDERAAVELSHARREGRSIAVATFDIDYFKHINDEWGHKVGDRVLARIGELLRSLSREVDVASRYGGEEFVVLLPDNDAADAEHYAERVRTALATEGSSGLPRVRMSAGVAAAREPSDVLTMLQQADSALYAAKRGGRDRTEIFARNAHPVGEPAIG